MIPVQIRDWHIFLRDGEQFLKTAQAAHRKKSRRFSGEAIYNLTCMGIEKLIMAFLMQRGDLAENHTMRDLLRALEQHIELGAGIGSKLLFLDSFQEICELDTYVTTKPNEEDLETIVDCGRALQAYLTPYIYQQ